MSVLEGARAEEGGGAGQVERCIALPRAVMEAFGSAGGCEWVAYTGCPATFRVGIIYLLYRDCWAHSATARLQAGGARLLRLQQHRTGTHLMRLSYLHRTMVKPSRESTLARTGTRPARRTTLQRSSTPARLNREASPHPRPTLPKPAHAP
jgi:hypothetical protein